MTIEAFALFRAYDILDLGLILGQINTRQEPLHPMYDNIFGTLGATFALKACGGPHSPWAPQLASYLVSLPGPSPQPPSK